MYAALPHKTLWFAELTRLSVCQTTTCLPKENLNDWWRRLVLHLLLQHTQAAVITQPSVCVGNVQAGTEAIGGGFGLFSRMTQFDALRVNLAPLSVQCISIPLSQDFPAGPHVFTHVIYCELHLRFTRVGLAKFAMVIAEVLDYFTTLLGSRIVAPGLGRNDVHHPLPTLSNLCPVGLSFPEGLQAILEIASIAADRQAQRSSSRLGMQRFFNHLLCFHQS